MHTLAAISRFLGSDTQINLLRGAVVLLFAVAAGRRFWSMHRASSEQSATQGGHVTSGEPDDPYSQEFERGYVKVTWIPGQVHPDIVNHGPLNILADWDASRINREGISAQIHLHDLVAWKPGAPRPLIDVEEMVFDVDALEGASSEAVEAGPLALQCKVVESDGERLAVLIGLVRVNRRTEERRAAFSY